jgi:hypothetical protein
MELRQPFPHKFPNLFECASITRATRCGRLLTVPKRILYRLLAVALVLSVGFFAVQTAGHWHAHESDAQHCQVCHIGHVAVTRPAAQVKLFAPMTVARFAGTKAQLVRFEIVGTHRIPRAPPV